MCTECELLYTGWPARCMALIWRARAHTLPFWRIGRDHHKLCAPILSIWAPVLSQSLVCNLSPSVRAIVPDGGMEGPRGRELGWNRTSPHTHTHTHTYIYIYIYITKKKYRGICVNPLIENPYLCFMSYIHIYIFIYICIYIYIYSNMFLDIQRYS